MDPIPSRVREIMTRLEAADRADRDDGTPRSKRLRAISPDVGNLLLTLTLATQARTIVEAGTSGGYSTLWLGVGATRNGGHVTTFEVDPVKVAIARRSFTDAGMGDVIDLRHEDAAAGLIRFDETADLVFIDAEKEDYLALLPSAISALRPGGLLVADNLTSHAADLEGFRDNALTHPQLTGLVAPVGRGELVAVKLAA